MNQQQEIPDFGHQMNSSNFNFIQNSDKIYKASLRFKNDKRSTEGTSITRTIEEKVDPKINVSS